MLNNLKLDRKKFIIFMFLILSSFLVTGILILDYDKPSYYNLLFMLPLVFAITSLFFIALYNKFLSNIAYTFLIFLFYIRMVISPLMMCYGNYTSTILTGVDINTTYAIFLVCYEFVAIIISMILISSKDYSKIQSNNYLLKGNKKLYFFIISLIILILIVCYKISPQLSLIYRNIFSINDVNFASQEDTFIIAKYGTTFVKKFALVLGNYLMRIMTLVLPAFLIVLTKSNRKSGYIMSLIFCFIPLLFIGGAIARSLIYIVCLLLLRNYLYDFNNSQNKKIIIVGFFTIIVIAIWWIFKSKTSSYNTVWQYFSNRLSTYFSGVNIVSGSMNLPNNLIIRFKYFIYDFLRSIPFSNTLFNIKDVTIDVLFNNYNNSFGQIPTTIGTSYYYFGFIFAPIYSIVFSLSAFSLSEKIRNKVIINPIQYMRIIYTIISLCMGVIMYNISITMSNIFTIIIPIYIIEIMAYGGDKNDT